MFFKYFREMLASLKELILEYVKNRLFPVTIIVIGLFAILVRQLFMLQIVDGEEHMQSFMYKAEKTLTVDSVRGNIYDRNGKLLAYNELSYIVEFSNDPNLAVYAEAAGMSENEYKNKIVYDTIKILEKNNDELSVDFNIELLDSGAYKYKIKEVRLKSFLKDVYSVTSFDDLSLEKKNSTAEEVVDYLKALFEISDTYTKEEAMQILAVRYKLWLNRYQQYMPVTIAYDISEESNAAITEHKDELRGMQVDVQSLRRYNYAEYFAHIIGYIGGISDEELEKYNAGLDSDSKYSSGEKVGKVGIEQYCESDLRGTNGYETMYVDNLGKIIETVESKSATAGNDVYLTLDAEVQKYCYDTLEKEIASVLLANITSDLHVEAGENVKIPITDVYYALFKNNYISIDAMGSNEASELEQRIYSAFYSRKENTISRLDNILTTEFTPLYNLSTDYQDYMEYICEILKNNSIYFPNLVPKESKEFKAYTSNKTSLEEYLKYAISIEAIDISSFEGESSYYDTEEIYKLLCDYIINYLSLDSDFDKLVIENMIKSGEITGGNVIDIIYEQGILDAQNDKEYAEYKNGAYSAYEFMLRKIKNIEITPAMLALDPCSGSVVVTDVKNGDVIAMVSYPSYDNNYLTNEIDADYYNKLLNDQTKPMYCRATQQQTAPGSTFKILSSIAGLTENVVDQSTSITCTGIYNETETPAKCWIYPGAHGGLEIEGAIRVSCNAYFYTIGQRLATDSTNEYNDGLGISKIQKYAALFGLDTASGVEIPEVSPHVSDNDAIRTCIGQGTNLYAPIQLSRYVTTVANNGTCYNLTLIDKITDYEGKLVKDNSATVLHQVDEVSDSTWNSVHNGMLKMVSTFTKSNSLFRTIDTDIAGKTGTAQESKLRPNHALFISYAPFDAPEVSVTCVIQNGYNSGNASELASFIYAYLYDPEKLIGAQMNGNTVVSD